MLWRCLERGLIAACAGLVAASAGCSGARPAGSAASRAVTAPALPALAGHEDGDLSRGLASLRGTPFVLAPFFASCTVRCPLTIDKLRRFSAALERRHVDAPVVLFTLDPRNDDRARLERFKAARHLPVSWRVLRGGLEETQALARALGVRAATDDAHIDHDVRIALFDARGQLVRSFGDWDFDDDEAAGLLSSSCADTPRRFDALFALARRENVHSVDDLVPLLPPALRSRYVLMRESRSAQEASAAAPRALLYTADASFVLTFNGEPGGPESGAIETLEFDPCTRSFRLRELAFAAAAGASDGGPVATASEVNPSRCLACHGSDPRPIWDSYPVWPGAFGEVEGASKTAREDQAFAAFERSEAGRPRYRSLLGQDGVLVRSPTRAQTRAEALYEGGRSLSRNADFGLRLEQLQERTIARRVLSAERFRPFRYALLAALDPQCLDVDSYLPPETRAQFARTARRFRDETDRTVAAADRAKSARLAAPAAADGPILRDTLTDFRYVVEEGLGLSTQGWALALEPDACDFTTGAATRVALERELLAAVAREDPALASLRGASDRPAGYCAALRRASLASLAGFERTPDELRTSSGRAPLSPSLSELLKRP